MRILITGAAGFIGGHLVQQLAREHEVFALVRQLPVRPHQRAIYLQQDLSVRLREEQLPKKLDAIIHQAALIDADRFGLARAKAVNVDGTIQLLQYAAKAGVQTFVHASTGGVYGCGQQPFVETAPYQPLDPYSVTKVEAEQAVQEFTSTFHTLILRYFFPYGVGTPNPIPQWVERALAGKTLEVQPDGRPHFNPLHISDAVEATVRALELAQSAIINVAGTQVTTFQRIAEMAAQLGHRQPYFLPIPEENIIPYYRGDLLADISRMQTLLNFTPQVTLQTGIAELTRFYLDQSV